MANMGILVDYEWCTGCHTCETACQHHCQAQCIKVGPVEELAKELVGKKHQVLFNN